jgi:uncharacterized protein
VGEQVSVAVHLVGLISDTHGLIRPEALDALRDSDVIVHCGDIGGPAVLKALRTIASVHAIRGNNDQGGWACNLSTNRVIEVGNHTIYVLHNISELDLDPYVARFTVVASGHSHKPVIEKRDKILFVNPGSAGPRRFSLPVTVARLALWSRRCDAEIVPLVVSQQSRTQGLPTDRQRSLKKPGTARHWG